MKRFLATLTLLVLAGRGLAGPRVEADPNKLYPITPEVGQWVISAASYMGPNARQMAREVVYQLRRRDNMPAYFFDYSEKEREDLANYLKDRKRPGHVRIQDQCGVLIGGYPDADTARKMLNEVKALKMPDLDKKSMDAMVNPEDGRIYYVNPFKNAFVTRNPAIPHAQQTTEADGGLRKLNSAEEYSLFKNPKEWTLAIKSYTGVGAFNSNTSSSSVVGSFWPKSKEKDVLGASGAQAHETARILRGLGMEAWILHTRRESIVCVGGFDGPDDPRLRETANKVNAWREKNIRTMGSDPFQIPVQLLPMRVPKS
jgi:hypothetical protein